MGARTKAYGGDDDTNRERRLKTLKKIDGTAPLPIFREGNDIDDEDLKSTYPTMARVGPSEIQNQGSTFSLGRQSLHFEDKAVNVEELGAFKAAFGLSNPEIQFIKKKVKCRVCSCYIEKPDQDPSLLDESKLCWCGFPQKDHIKEAMRNATHTETWNYQKHTRAVPTNAFGELEFVGYGDKVGKYIRMDVDTPMEVTLALLNKVWGLEKPNLLISVSGGAKNFSMKTRLREVFRRGLMKAAVSTGAWIVTSGTNAGVMKIVGEAVRDFGLTAEGKVVAIGIASWGCVQNKEQLIDKDGKWPAGYRLESVEKAAQVLLDPYHTHFILIDNGTQHKYQVEIPYRAKLEEAIREQKTDTGTDAVSIPGCLLIVEGGAGTLQQVHVGLSSKMPTVVIKGSGKVADILAYASQNAKEEKKTTWDQQGNACESTTTYLDPRVRAEIEDMVRTQLGDKNLTTLVSWVEECCCNYPDLLSVFELDSQHSAKDVDLAILQALLKANKNQIMDQLKLALAWNRIDVAKTEIFTDDRRWPSGMLDEVMMSAIQLNRVDFVELFLDNGVSLKDFLTTQRLLILYNNIPHNCLLYSLLKEIKEKHRHYFSLADVGHLLQSLLGDYYQPNYLTEKHLRHINVDALFGNEVDSKITLGIDAIQRVTSTPLTGTYVDPLHVNQGFERPAHEIFIWALLMNYHKLSKLFWREGKDSSTGAALFANSVLKSLMNRTPDAEQKRQLQSSADDYAHLAVGVINTCYSSDEKRAHDLLICDMPQWGKSTCVLLAVQAKNKEFIAQTACQTLITKVWYGDMMEDNSLWRIVSSILLFPLIQVLIKFRQDEDRTNREFGEVENTQSKKKDKQDDKKKPALTREATRPELTRQQTFGNILDAAPREKKAKHYNFLKKHIKFYQSPVTKFILNVISYALFLLLYAYILVVELSQDFHFLEAILMAWVFSIAVEEVRQFATVYAFSLKSMVGAYFRDSWNILDIVSILLFVLGMTFRFVDGDNYLSAARVVLSINFMIFFSRILHMFSVNPQLGPKLVMIYQMMQDLMVFVFILLVFIVSYAIASEAILFPNSELNWKLFFYLPRKAYWSIYGEFQLEEIEGTNDCTENATLYNDYEVFRCPSTVGKYFVPVLMGIYVLMTNVLLLNLLIAIFSYTFQRIQENSHMHWCFQRFNLVREYVQWPVSPFPFIIFFHIYALVAYCCRRCGFGQDQDEFRKVFPAFEEKQLMQWENVIADCYLDADERLEQDSLAVRLKLSVERLDTILAKAEVLQEGQGSPMAADQSTTSPAQSPIEKRMETFESQLIHTTKALQWIMASLQENNLSAKTHMPILPDLQKQKDEERKKKKEREEQEKKLVQDLLEKKILSHYKSRISPYPGTAILRFDVPDDKVLWEIDYPGYSPPTYTSTVVLNKPHYADDDLLAMRHEDRQCLTFNAYDKRCKISRESLVQPYKIVEGLPMNPVGRTGLKGRGSLGRWGPNHAGDPVLTRWKILDNGSCAQVDGKPVLEFVAVQRLDNKLWSIPGAICGPGEQPLNVLKTEFQEETLGTLLDEPEVQDKLQSSLAELSKNEVEIYRGYADDPRNTDNAWIETRVVNYHDEDGSVLQSQMLRASDEVSRVSWQTVSSSLPLHGAHSYFLKLVAEHHQAAS